MGRLNGHAVAIRPLLLPISENGDFPCTQSQPENNALWHLETYFRHVAIVSTKEMNLPHSPALMFEKDVHYMCA